MKILSLDGSWKVRFSDFQRGRPWHADLDTVDPVRYLDATVPGEIHLDLMNQGIIPDVYSGTNVLAARWVEEQIWSYRKVFDAQADARTGRAWLVFDRLDYAAKIVLNGQPIAEHANFFHPLRVEITGKLRESGNVLAVHLDSGLYHVSDKPAEGWFHGNADDLRLHKRHWLRKPQSQFSWDWAPRLINVGIQGSVRLEYSADDLLIQQFAPVASVDENLKDATVRARLFATNPTDKPINAMMRVSIDDTNATTLQPVVLPPGESHVEATLALDSPKLWWPIGHGDQPLYTVRASIESEATTYEVSPRQVGFRRVRVIQDPHPAGGRYFRFEVNNRPIFCKGGNYVPADLIISAIDDDRTRTLIDRAVEANFNLLRVWGGGLYESEAFYDECDRRGILVWQEFIFACGRYPTCDENFQRSVITEAKHQIRRLAHRPSLIAWCGNNENEMGLWSWGMGERGVIAPDYAWYHLTLPRLLKADHPEVYYQPSSPFSPDHLTPNHDLVGDQHPWNIGFNDMDFRRYRDMPCRFPNEGGILGPTSLPTMLRCLPEGQQFVQSLAWQVHDNSVDSWREQSTVDAMTDFWLGLNCREMTVKQYVYWAGVIHGEGLREYIDNFRRRAFDTSAAVFWMFNDAWPATRSWTIVDHALNRTPAFHHVRRAFAPVRVVLVESADQVVIYGINDTPNPLIANLRFGLFNTAGKYLLDQTQDAVNLPANASIPIAHFDRAVWTDPKTQIIFATLNTPDGKPITRNRLILPLYKEMKWLPPKITVSVKNHQATFICDTFAFNLCLDLHGQTALADNFFDLYPNQPHTFSWPHQQPPAILYVGNHSSTGDA